MNIPGKGCILLCSYGFLILNFGFISTKEYDDDELGVRRNLKSFSLFSVVTFKNEECTSESTFAGGAVQGTCYSSTECSDKDGTASGNCAAGFGVCCTFISNIGTATISENRTILQSLLFPTVETSTTGITYTVNKMQSDICQLRLDFSNFAIAGPTVTDETLATTGTNCADSLTTTLSSGQIIPVICGSMTGSHLYLEMGMDAADTASLVMAFAGTPMTAATAMRSWRIKTSQIPCWASYRAPAGCHQYFFGSAFGQLWSPNFRTGPSTTTSTAFAAGNTAAASSAPNYAVDLMGLDLKYCIRREKNMCCTMFQVCNFDPDGVAITEAIAGGALIEGTQGLIDPGFSFQIDCHPATGAVLAATAIGQFMNIGLTDEDCTADYVEIPDSQTGVKSYGSATQTFSRYCCHRLGMVPSPTTLTAATPVGGLKHAPLYDCTEPFEVLYHTDIYTDGLGTVTLVADVVTLIARGMCLLYRQEGC